MALCYFKTEAEAERMSLKEQHQRYIGQNSSRIVFGGLVPEMAESAGGVCIFIRAQNPSEVSSFLRKDPYYPLYRQVRIEAFIQRIPETTEL